MMQQTLKTALETVSGLNGKTFPLIAAEGIPAPYAVYGRVATSPENTLDGAAGFDTRMQVDYYAASYSAALVLAQAGSAAILLAFPAGLCVMHQDLHDDVTGLYRVLHDYSIFHATA